MKSSMLALGLALTIAGGAFAQTEDDEHAAHHPEPQATQPADATQRPTAPRAGAADFKSVEDLMARIQQAGDSAQRAELLRQHAVALRAQVRAMRAASAKRMAMMGGDKMTGGDKQAGSASDDPHAAHKAAADAGSRTSPQPDANADDPHAGHKAEASDEQQAGKGGKKGMMGGGMMKMHESVERRLDAVERVLEQLIEREVVEGGTR